MIKTFTCNETEKIFNRKFSRRIAENIQRSAYRKLLILHASTNINDLRTPPANRLERLTGDRDGQHSIRINDQWRICFKWENNNAYNVEIADYH